MITAAGSDSKTEHSNSPCDHAIIQVQKRLRVLAYALLGDGFMRKLEIEGLPPRLSELVDTDSPRYELKLLSEEDLIAALSAYSAS